MTTDPELRPWDVCCRYANTAMARVLRAVIECRGQITDSYLMSSPGYPSHWWPLLLRIKLPVGTEDRFREISQAEMTTPPKVEGT